VAFTNLPRYKAWMEENGPKLLARDFKLVQKKVALELLRRCAEKTPVDTGRAKGGWQLTLDTPATGQTGRLDEAGMGEASGESIASGLAVLAGLRAWQVVWLANNVAYIGALEHGHSKRQAPQGMLGLSIEEVESMFP